MYIFHVIYCSFCVIINDSLIQVTFKTLAFPDMEPLSDALKLRISELLDKAEHTSLVQSVRQILGELKTAGLAYEMKLLPRLVGTHPANRDGFGISPVAVHDLISSIFSLGFDHHEVRCLCVEVRPGDTSVNEYNRTMIAGSGGMLAALEGEVRFASLWGGHTNQALRCIAGAVKHSDERLCHNGHLSIEKIRTSDPVYADAALHGVTWTVLNCVVLEAFPSLASLIQSAGNAVSQVSKSEHEFQVLRKLWIAYMREQREKPSQPVQFSAVKQRVQRSRPPRMKSIPAMYQWMLKCSGGAQALFLLESEQFIKVHGDTDVVLNSELWELMSVDLKGVEQFVRFRHGLLKCLYADAGCKLSPADVKRFSSKELSPKVLAANDLMTEVRQFLADNQVELADLWSELGWLDVNLVKFVLGKHSSSSLLMIVQSFLSDVKAKFKLADLVSPWDVSPGSSASSAQDPSPAVPNPLRELGKDAKLDNPCNMLVEKGLQIGVSVMRKADKVLGYIHSMAGASVIVRTGDGQVEVCPDDFLDGKWVRNASKVDAVEEISEWFRHAAHECQDFKVLHVKSMLTHEMYELASKHEPRLSNLRLLSKPKKQVLVDNKIEKGKCIVVPSTLRIGTCRDGAAVPSGAVGLGQACGVTFFLSPTTILPGSRATPFLCPFWFIDSSSELELINMEIMYHTFKVPGGKLSIPIAKNNVVLKPGDRLILPEGSLKTAEEVKPETDDKKLKRAGKRTRTTE